MFGKFDQDDQELQQYSAQLNGEEEVQPIEGLSMEDFLNQNTAKADEDKTEIGTEENLQTEKETKRLRAISMGNPKSKGPTRRPYI